MLNEDALKTAIETSSDWEHAVDDFIDCTTQLGQPFTSGHVTTMLRVYRPEFRFAHREIGERCQDLFHSGAIQFQGKPAVQVPRVCAGLGRTPAGTAVMTYAFDEPEANAFPFELDIPVPGAGLKVMPQEHPIQAAPQGAPLTPNLPTPTDLRATVHADLRLCVPRAALEALIHKTGQSVRGGDPVWVRHDHVAETAHITLDQQPGAVNYDVSATRGRVLFPKPGAGQFEHGDVYQCEVHSNALVVDLSQTV